MSRLREALDELRKGGDMVHGPGSHFRLNGIFPVRILALSGSLLAAIAISPAQASETVTYTYDALGRLTASTTSGGPNGGVSAGTSFDPAGNRTGYNVSGGSMSLQQASTTSTTTPAALSKPIAAAPDHK